MASSWEQKMDALEVDRHLLFNYLLLVSEDGFFFIAKRQEEKTMSSLVSAELSLHLDLQH